MGRDDDASSDGGTLLGVAEDGQRAPPWLIMLLGVLVTPTVIVGFTILDSVWLTYASLYYLWVVAPTAVCFCWSSSRRQLFASLQRGWRQQQRLQWLLAVPVAVIVIGSCMLAYHLLAAPLGLDLDAVRERLAEYGLTPENPAGDLGALAWLTFLNPLMEEFFWRLFLFEGLRPLSSSSSGNPRARWWWPATLTSMLYASYHVPIVWQFIPPVLAALSFCGLVIIGLSLQHIVYRYGLILAVAVHFAYDACVSLIVADVIWGLGIATSPAY